MNNQLSVETAICTEHERLHVECQKALEIWNEHRAEICRARLIGKEAGDELLRLQAKYARAYTTLQNHTHHCPQCQLASKIDECDSESNANTLSDSELYV